MWFDRLTGFEERSPEQVRDNILVEGETMTFLANRKRFACGRLETPTLAELRERVGNIRPKRGRLSVSEVVGNVQELHQDRDNAGACFQVASQFNLLEMVSPSMTPEHGVDMASTSMRTIAHKEWIFPAIERALGRVSELDLDVSIVSYGSSQLRVRELAQRWRS